MHTFKLEDKRILTEHTKNHLENVHAGYNISAQMHPMYNVNVPKSSNSA